MGKGWALAEENGEILKECCHQTATVVLQEDILEEENFYLFNQKKEEIMFQRY